MELRPITPALTKTLVVIVFWTVFLLDLFLGTEISFQAILWALGKAVVVSGVFWILFALLVDTMLKSMVADIQEKKVERVDGGLSYHLTEPSAEEKAWLREQEQEEEGHKKTPKNLQRTQRNQR
jgi:hypothetical protein